MLAPVLLVFLLTALSTSSSSSNTTSNTTSPSSPTSSPPSSPSSTLPELVLVSTPLSWSEARSYCRQNHTDLASFTGPDDQLRIPVTPDQDITVAWIGLRSYWIWSDGSKLWQNKFRNWSWADTPGSGDCVHTRNDWKWHNHDCKEELPFICYGKSTPLL
ncbi:C-type mannose receptor 2-like [Sardina pilchardus]|uniref:C-type mannose receptor 2-like n=1 Tax=Sardina pilchardus TaxID=27697 RepID=UPI002E11D7A9